MKDQKMRFILKYKQALTKIYIALSLSFRIFPGISARFRISNERAQQNENKAKNNFDDYIVSSSTPNLVHHLASKHP